MTPNVDSLVETFTTRPDTLEHLLQATYGILRQAGVPLGKRDYMRHLVKLLSRSRD